MQSSPRRSLGPLGHDLKFGYYSFKKMFWNFFVVMDRVVDLATAHHGVGIIAGGSVSSHFSLLGDLLIQRY